MIGLGCAVMFAVKGSMAVAVGVIGVGFNMCVVA